MKILFLTNNQNTESLIRWLRKEKHETVFVHSKKLTPKNLKFFNPEFILSYNYHYIISQKILRLVNCPIINLHISLLPWNRGSNPNIWSFLEDTPKGVTIHKINKNIDDGDIILQKKINIDEKLHTLSSSYLMLQQEIQKLFKTNWEKIKTNKIKATRQKGKGSMHRQGEYAKISARMELTSWDISILELKNKYKKYKQLYEF